MDDAVSPIGRRIRVDIHLDPDQLVAMDRRDYSLAESRHLKDVAEVDAIHDREYGQLPSRLPDLGLKFQSLIMERGDHMFQMRFEVELRFGNHEGEV